MCRAFSKEPRGICAQLVDCVGRAVRAVSGRGCLDPCTGSFLQTFGSQKGVSQGVSQRVSTILDSLEAVLVWRVPSPLLSSLSSRRTCPPEICFPPFRLSKPSGQNYSRLDAWQRVCLQCHGGFADQRFFLGRRENFAAVPYHFLSRVVGQEVRILVIRHHHRYLSFGSRRR